MRQRISFRTISLKQFLFSTVLPILVLFLALTWYDTRQSFCPLSRIDGQKNIRYNGKERGQRKWKTNAKKG